MPKVEHLKNKSKQKTPHLKTPKQTTTNNYNKSPNKTNQQANNKKRNHESNWTRIPYNPENSLAGEKKSSDRCLYYLHLWRDLEFKNKAL